MRRALLVAVVVTGTVAGFAVGSGSASPAGSSPATVTDPGADFNGDGFDDLAIGVPGEDISTEADAGAVNVLYGGGSGLQTTSPPDQLWFRSPGVSGGLSADDHFGATVSAADFNGDGFDDLAVGAPDDDLKMVAQAGRVNVIYGSSSGLVAAGSQLWDQGTRGVRGSAEADDRFGASLTAGFFNDDAFADLAVGIPGDPVGAITSAGAVAVLYGSAAGLQADSPDDQLWNQNGAGVKEESQTGDEFGASVVSGDFDGDGFDDLAIGAPGDDSSNRAGAGTVNVIFGSSTGLQAGQGGTDDQIWTQDSTDIEDDVELGDQFGRSLAAGDLDGDSMADLVVGVPLEDVGTLTDAGAANVLYGSPSGLGSAGNQIWHQDSTDINDLSEPGDQFGLSVAVGDFNGNGFADLAAGVALENNGAVADGGAVNVIYGTAAGLSSAGDQYWNQNSANIEDTAEMGDGFGSTVVAGEFGNGPQTDLIAAAPFEDVGAIVDAGAINAIYGTAAGLSATGDQLWHQDSTDIDDDAEETDLFGSSLAA